MTYWWRWHQQFFPSSVLWTPFALARRFLFWGPRVYLPVCRASLLSQLLRSCSWLWSFSRKSWRKLEQRLPCKKALPRSLTGSSLLSLGAPLRMMLGSVFPPAWPCSCSHGPLSPTPRRNALPSWPDLGPAFSPRTCLVTAGLCLNLAIVSGPDVHHESWHGNTCFMY